MPPNGHLGFAKNLDFRVWETEAEHFTRKELDGFSFLFFLFFPLFAASWPGLRGRRNYWHAQGGAGRRFAQGTSPCGPWRCGTARGEFAGLSELGEAGPCDWGKGRREGSIVCSRCESGRGCPGSGRLAGRG